MRLVEAILEANQRASAGDSKPALQAEQFAESLPLAILTCMDPRLNRLVPKALNLPDECYFWTRNAGNVVTGLLGSAVRSLALACTMKNAREIAVIGHTNCQTCRTTMVKLTDAFKLLGVDRSRLPENLTEFFGMFASEQQNVIKGADFVRQSPLISARVPVHGLLLDIESGKLEWLVNGYQNLPTGVSVVDQIVSMADQSADLLKSFPKFEYGEMKFPESKIGEVVSRVGDLVSDLKQPSSGIGETIQKAAHAASDVRGIVSELLQPQAGEQPPKPQPEAKTPPSWQRKTVSAPKTVPPVIQQEPLSQESGRSRPPKYSKGYGSRKGN